MLEIKNLHAEIDGKSILNGLNLTVPTGEVAAIMGPNGSGKSTLSYVLAGKADYEVTQGEVLLDGENILELAPEERAARGVFLAFQYPLEIPGVATMTFLKAALNAQRKARGDDELLTPDFMKRVRSAAAQLQIPQDMLKRALNVGFSGGEKKRMEILQMALLEPSFCILDETDSGLDIDALRIVAGGVNALRLPDRAFLVITHYQRLLNHIVPDSVHVMAGGRIVRSGGPELALELEANGYADYRQQDAAEEGGMAAELKIVRTPAEEALTQRFPALKGALPGDAKVLRLREAAFDLIARRGLPHRRVEEWKYTDLRALMREAAPFAEKPSSAEIAAAFNGARAFAKVDALRLTLVNGHFVPELSDLQAPAGVEIVPLGEGLAAGHPLLASLGPVEAARENAAYALNTAFMNDGLLIRVAAGTEVETLLHLRFVNDGSAAFATATRVLAVVEEGASITLIESHEGTGDAAHQLNDVVEIVARDRASLTHVRLNAEGPNALALSTLTAKLGREVSLYTVNVVAGAAVSRHQIFLTYAGE